jgi:glycosyltransferase involved in cell wall biosynthesis
MKKQTKPFISVIIPAHNEKKYIDACLTALTHQKTRVPYEILVVDNLSTDKTSSRSSAYHGVRLLKENRLGLAFTRNKGAKYAKGDILSFVDADCVVQKNYIQNMYELFAKHPKIAGVTGPYIYRDGSWLIHVITGPLHYFQFHFFISKMLFRIQMLLGGNVAFRKKEFRQLGGFNETITSINDPEDLEMAIRCYRAGKHILFSQELAVESSFRRMNNTILRDGPTRLKNQYRRLFALLVTC